MPIRVAIADPHALIRNALADVLELQPDMTIVGEAGDGERAVEIVRRLRPDVLLVNVLLPAMNGIEAAAKIAAVSPGVRVVGLADDDDLAAMMRRAGASACIPKASPLPVLLSAIRGT